MAPNFICGLFLLCVGICVCNGKSLIAIERISEFFDEDSDIDTTGALRFLSTVLQTERELPESDGTGPFNLGKNCSHGQCSECTNIQGQRVCLVAKIIPKGFSVAMTLKGKVIFDMKVTVPNPKPVCKKSIPGFSMVHDVCLELTGVDLTKKKACVTVSAKVAGHEMKKKIGCFEIPSKEIESPSDFEENPDEIIKELDDLSTALTLLGLDEVGPDDLVGKCGGGKCSFCVKKFLKVCAEAEVTAKGIKLTLTFSGKVVFQKEIDIAKPYNFCIGDVPGIPMISKVCIQVDHIDLKAHSACVSVSFQVKPFKKFAFKIGCFHIPIIEEDGGQTAEVEMI